MHHKLLSARMMQQQGRHHRNTANAVSQGGSASLDESDAVTAAETAATLEMAAATPSARVVDHVPLNSSLSQIVSRELGCPELQPFQDPLLQLQRRQHLQEVAQQTTENAIVAMMAKTAATALAFAHRSSAAPAMAVAPPIVDRAAIDRASLTSLHLQQLLLHQQRQLQNPIQRALLLQQHSQQAPPRHCAQEPPPRVKPVRAPTASAEDESTPANKKRRLDDEDGADQFEDDDDDPTRRFRPYQSEQWTEKFQELCDFRKAKGHCQVPHTFAENPPLARWVKRQRYQYKLKAENRQSTMTDERIEALENIGFIWDSHAAAWAEKLQELKEYAKAMGNCNVPSTYPENPQLATWVKCQRRQFKLLRDGKTSNMTGDRISQLESLGFVWEMRKS